MDIYKTKEMRHIKSNEMKHTFLMKLYKKETKQNLIHETFKIN